MDEGSARVTSRQSVPKVVLPASLAKSVSPVDVCEVTVVIAEPVTENVAPGKSVSRKGAFPSLTNDSRTNGNRLLPLHKLSSYLE